MPVDSKLVGTSSSTRTLDERDLAALRPAIEVPLRDRRRKPAALREVTSGVVCFCGERFGEHQALEFMLHLRAEVGEYLTRIERRRTVDRETARRRMADPATAEKVRARHRESERRRRQDPEYAERVNAHAREWWANRTPGQAERIRERQRAANLTPEQLERRRARKRGQYQARLERERARGRAANLTPEQLERRREANRRYRAKKKAECGAAKTSGQEIAE